MFARGILNVLRRLGRLEGGGLMFVALAALAVIAPAALDARGSTVDRTIDPSGRPMPTRAPRGWQIAFADNFANEKAPLGSWTRCHRGSTIAASRCRGLPPSLYAKWWAYPDGWPGTPRSAVYYPSRVLSVEGGTLDYHLHSQRLGGRTVSMIAATLPRIHGGSSPSGGLLYCRYVIRARWDAIYGYHISFLLWPDSKIWPGDGEIDFPEADLDSRRVGAFMHWQGATTPHQQDAFKASVNPTRWHTYEVDWLPGLVSFYLDGRRIGRARSRVPRTSMHLVLQVGRSFTERGAVPAVAGEVQVDWVEVDARRPGR